MRRTVTIARAGHVRDPGCTPGPASAWRSIAARTAELTRWSLSRRGRVSQVVSACTTRWVTKLARVGEREQIAERERGPAPAVGLARHDRERREALQREHEEHEQRGDRGWIEHGAPRARIDVGADRRAQRGVRVARRVDLRERRDDHLARGEAREQADADLPIEAERRDHRLDRAPGGSGEAVLERVARRLLRGSRPAAGRSAGSAAAPRAPRSR